LVSPRIRSRESPAHEEARLAAESNLAREAGGNPDASEILSGLGLYWRCHSHLTGRVPSRASGYFEAVRDGRMGGLEACLEILEGSVLNDQGGITFVPPSGRVGGASPEQQGLAQAVLRNFHDFHRTWFAADDFKTALPDGARWPQTAALHDEQAPALYITRAFFKTEEHYGSVVTLPQNLEALREGGAVPLSGALSRVFKQFVQVDAQGNPIALESGNEKLGVQKGALLGVRPVSENPARSDKKIRLSNFRNQELPLQFHLGGGILGNQTYLLANLGTPTERKSDGGVTVGRRHARNAYRELLCRDMPSIRELDAVRFVQASNLVTARTPAFRLNGTCMACHASMDGFAGTTRQVFHAPINASGNSIGSMHLVREVRSQPAEANPGFVDSDPQFAARPPQGRLVYRSHNGELVDQSVASLQELGERLASGEDLYVCAAKRYFQYFTGIDISLQDPGDPLATPLSEADQAYRELVVRLGLEFKEHGSLKRLIRRILELPLYQSRGQRDLFKASNTSGEDGS